MRTAAVVFSTLFLSGLVTPQSGTLDLSFNATDSGFGTGDSWDTPYALDMVQQPDGKLIVAGGFVRYNSIPRSRLARLNTDGSLDPTFNPGSAIIAGEALAVVLQPDGRIVVGGQFTTGGSGQTNIRRFLANGSTDASFAVGSGFDDIVFDLVLQPDGRVIATGSFTNYNGTPCLGIARLNADGSLDSSFAPASTAYFHGQQLALGADGKLLVAGSLAVPTALARLNPNGSLDIGFTPVAGAGSVRGVVLQPDGKSVIHGSFGTVNGVARHKLARLNADGSLDASFDAGTGPASNTPLSITVRTNGKIVVSGAFTTWNGQSAPGIVLLNEDGSQDLTFDAGSGFDGYSEVLEQSDGNLACIGTFKSYQGHARTGIARLLPGGALDQPFAPQHGINSDVRSLAVRPDGKVIAAGGLRAANGRPREGLAQFHADGSLDEAFVPESIPSNDYWWDLALDGAGRLVACSQYTVSFSDQRGSVVRFLEDGSLDPAFTTGDGPDDHVYSVAVQADGKVLIGGNFLSVDGTARGRIARLNEDGSVDTTFDPGTGFDDRVWCVRLQPDGRVLVSGEFDTFNGLPSDNLVRLLPDGSLDPAFNADFAALTVRDLLLQPDGKVLFVSDGSTNTLRRLHTDGSLDLSFEAVDITTGTAISCIELTATGKVIVGGMFTALNNVPVKNIALFHADGTLDETFQSGTGFDRPGSDLGTGVLALRSGPGGQFLAGGTFTAYDGVGRNRIARINVDNSTAVPSVASAAYAVWPVPVDAGTDLSIELPCTLSPASGYTIVDAAGRTFQAHLHVEGLRARLGTQGLAPGLYSLMGLHHPVRFLVR